MIESDFSRCSKGLFPLITDKPKTIFLWVVVSLTADFPVIEALYFSARPTLSKRGSKHKRLIPIDIGV